jgi:hypothetical protein
MKSGVYAFGPFFCYPWKPIINFYKGDSYSVGYKHFYTQHKDPTNLAMHFVCLFFQLFGNFSFLSVLDKSLLPAIGLGDGSTKYLSLSSAGLWTALSVLAPSSNCPLPVKLFSASAIAAAYRYAPRYSGKQIELAAYTGFSIVFVLHVLRALANSATKSVKESLRIDKQGVTILAALVGKWALYSGLKRFGMFCLILSRIYLFLFTLIYLIYFLFLFGLVNVLNFRLCWCPEEAKSACDWSICQPDDAIGREEQSAKTYCDNWYVSSVIITHVINL